MRRRGLVMLLAMALLLAGALAFSALLPGTDAASDDANTLANAVLDKMRITQRAEVAEWAGSDTAPDPANPDTPVWIARNGHTIHSRPVCGGMTSPVRYRLGDLDGYIYAFCPNCW